MIKVWDAALQAYKDIAGLRIRRPDGVLVDAQAARKMVGGTWVDVWPEQRYLYKAGDECSGITGGWRAMPYTLSGWGGTPTAPNLTKGTDSMSASSVYPNCGAISTYKRYLWQDIKSFAP